MGLVLTREGGEEHLDEPWYLHTAHNHFVARKDTRPLLKDHLSDQCPQDVLASGESRTANEELNLQPSRFEGACRFRDLPRELLEVLNVQLHEALRSNREVGLQVGQRERLPGLGGRRLPGPI